MNEKGKPPPAVPPKIAPLPGPRAAPLQATRPPPAVPALARAVRPEDLAELQRLSQNLDTMDYFQLLHLERSAGPQDIKRSFYQWSRVFHPDKFYQLKDMALKERVHDVYKRITEAYYVLKDDTKRAKYLADLASPTAKLRFTEASEAESKAAKKKEIEEQIGTHPKGRQFYQTGVADLEAGRWANAERNFKMALTFEPANAKYKEKLKEAADKVFQSTRGDPFKIK